MKYRHRPLQVEAVQLGYNTKFSETPAWLVEAALRPSDEVDAIWRQSGDAEKLRLTVKNGGNTVLINVHDWIVNDNGDLSVLDSAKFRRLYESEADHVIPAPAPAPAQYPGIPVDLSAMVTREPVSATPVDPEDKDIPF